MRPLLDRAHWTRKAPRQRSVSRARRILRLGRTLAEEGSASTCKHRLPGARLCHQLPLILSGSKRRRSHGPIPSRVIPVPGPPLPCPRPPPPPLQPRVPGTTSQYEKHSAGAATDPERCRPGSPLPPHHPSGFRPAHLAAPSSQGQRLQGLAAGEEFVIGLQLADFRQVWARSLSSGANPSSTSSCDERWRKVQSSATVESDTASM